MSEELFAVALKSTVDKIGYDLAQAEVPPIPFIDLDNVVNTAELLTSEQNAYVWNMAILAAVPKDPLYSCMFTVGARTINDPANYDIMKLVGKLKVAFNVGSSLDIKDYTGAVAGDKIGVLTVARVAVLPQEFDKVSGIRLISLEAKAVRIG